MKAQPRALAGTVTVTVTVDESAITAVEATGGDETPAIGGAALATVAQAIVDAQGTGVDAVAGATITSNAVLQAAVLRLRRRAEKKKPPLSSPTASTPPPPPPTTVPASAWTP